MTVNMNRIQTPDVQLGCCTDRCKELPPLLILKRPPSAISFKDVDIEGFRAQFPRHRAHTLTFEHGTHVGGEPGANWFTDLSEFTARTLECGHTAGYDLRASDGRLYSRWVSVPLNVVYYSRVSAAAAKYFDDFIDRACCK